MTQETKEKMNTEASLKGFIFRELAHGFCNNGLKQNEYLSGKQRGYLISLIQYL